MAKKILPPKKPHPLQRVREEVEVQVGLFALPEPEGEEGGAAAAEPEEALVWMLVDGPLLGDEVGSRADLLAQAGPLLRESLKNLPYLPGTVRASSADLVAALRPQVSSRVQLVEGPTPELDEVAAEMIADDGEIPSYLGAGADEKVVASFFAAAAKLYRAQPWKAISADHLIGVTIEDLAMHDEVLAVIGPSRSSKPGFILANDAQELDDYGEAMERDEAGEEVTFPPIQMVVFEPRGDLLPELVEEITSHRWEVAGPKACPYVATMGADGLFEPPEEQDFVLGEALSKALAELVAQTVPLRKALAGDMPPLVLETTIELHGDQLKVRLTAPFLDEDAPPKRPEHKVLADLFDLEADEEIDAAERKHLEQKLLAEFKASAAGENYPSPQFVPKVLEIAATDLGITAASLMAGALEDVLFEILPGRGGVGPDSAEALIAECHAFFQFLAADCGQEHAYACVELLDSEDIVKDLQEALAQEALFGVAHPKAEEPPAPEKKNSPSPADRNKTKTAGPPKGSSRRRR